MIERGKKVAPQKLKIRYFVHVLVYPASTFFGFLLAGYAQPKETINDTITGFLPTTVPIHQLLHYLYLFLAQLCGLLNGENT